VYAALALTWDRASVGSVHDEVTGVGVGEVQEALLAPLAARYRLVPSSVGEAERAAARDLLARHRAVPGRAGR